MGFLSGLSTRSKSPFASLPPEILDAILEQLVPPPWVLISSPRLFSKPSHYRQLRQAALVQRSWRFPAGRLLHLHVVIDSAATRKGWLADSRRRLIATRGLVVTGIRLSEAEDILLACRPGVELLGVSLSEWATPQFLLLASLQALEILVLRSALVEQPPPLVVPFRLSHLTLGESIPADLLTALLHPATPLTSLDLADMERRRATTTLLVSALLPLAPHLRSLSLPGGWPAESLLPVLRLCSSLERLKVERLTPEILQALLEAAPALATLAVARVADVNLLLSSVQGLPKLRKLTAKGWEALDVTWEEEWTGKETLVLLCRERGVHLTFERDTDEVVEVEHRHRHQRQHWQVSATLAIVLFSYLVGMLPLHYR